MTMLAIGPFPVLAAIRWTAIRVNRSALGKAHWVFGEKLPKLLDELNEVLAA